MNYNQIRNNILSFIIPSNDPEQLMDTLLPSLSNLNELKQISTFCFLFQEKFNKEQIEYVTEYLKKENINFRISQKQYFFKKGETPILQMRYDASMLNPTSLFYAFLDDDMAFLSGKNEQGLTIDLQYLNAIYNMITKNISVVLFKDKSESPEVNSNLVPLNMLEENLWTSRGLIVKGEIYNNSKGLLDENLIYLYGCNEDILTCLIKTQKGKSNIFKISNAVMSHYENRHQPGYLEYNWSGSNRSLNTVTRYILENYGVKETGKLVPLDTIEEFEKNKFLKIRNVEDQLHHKIEYNLNADSLLSEIIRISIMIYNTLENRKFDFHNILTFSLPTCEPETMFKILLPSIKNIKGLKDICTFAINFQSPYTQEQIQQVINEFRKNGLRYTYTYSEYPEIKNEGIVPFAKIRQDSSLLVPNSLFYAELDDDMQFLKGPNPYNLTIELQYLNVINRMLKDPKVGCTILTDPKQPEWLNTKIYYENIQLSKTWTNRGIVLRGGIYYGFKGMYSPRLVSMIGGGTDCASCCERMELGQNLLSMGYTMCNHIQQSDKGSEGAYQHGWAKNDDNPNSIRTFIINNWNPNYYNDWLNFDNEHAIEIYKKGASCILTEEDRYKNSFELSYDKDELIKEIKELSYNQVQNFNS